MKLDDTFKIYKHHDMSGEDYLALARYYLPLISPDALSLYLYVYTLNMGKDYTVPQTLDCVGLGNEKDLNRALSRLEATGLIKTYDSDTKGYLLELITPLSSSSFLDNPLLSKALSQAIGQDAVDELKKSHKTVSLKDYNDISKAFNDVFDIRLDDMTSQKITKRRKKEQIVLNDNSFNYIGFKNSIDESLVDPRVFDDKEMEQAILETAYMYNLDEDNMRDCIYRSLNFDHDLTIDLIKKHAGRIYREKGIIQTPKVEIKSNEAKNLSSNDSGELIKLLNSMSPEAFLKSLNNNHAVSVQELKDMDRLKTAFPFDQGMINAMYLIVFNQINSIPNYNYMEKVANEWLRQEINSIDDAIDYYNNLKTNSYNKPKKQVVQPEWLQQAQDAPVEEKANSELSASEIEKILEKRRNRK